MPAPKEEVELVGERSQGRKTFKPEYARKEGDVYEEETVLAHKHNEGIASRHDDIHPDTRIRRESFTERLELESGILKEGPRATIFLFLFTLFLVAIGTYDPTALIGDVHTTLKIRWATDEIDQVNSNEGIYNYMDKFISVSYLHAAALVDATTLDAISPNVCFDPQVSAICQLNYWVGDWNKTAILLNLTQPRDTVFLDKTENAHDYPFQSVVPLAPAVFQERAPMEPCDGFGNLYNEKIINSSSFASPFADQVLADDPYPTYNIIYLTPAFQCINSAMREATFSYMDKDTGEPGSDFSTKFMGREVFFKFITHRDNLTRTNFIDAQTVRFVMAVLVITPQPAQYLDITTFLQVEFTTSQYGLVESQARIDSTSQTDVIWYFIVGITVFFAFVYTLFSFMLIVTSAQKSAMYYFDVICGGSVIAYLGFNFVTDISPPVVADELRDAFERNAQLMYFRAFETIAEYSEKGKLIKLVGFFLTYVLFTRLILYLTMHPKIAVMVDTLRTAGDAIYHFFISFFALFLVLAFLAFWMFGTSIPEFQTYPMALETQFKMVIGDWPWESEDAVVVLPIELMVIYFLSFGLIIFFILMNFFLAIVVDAFTRVKNENLKNKVCKTFIADLYEMLLFAIMRRKNGWPGSRRLLEFLYRVEHMRDHDVTPHELTSIRNTKMTEEQAEELTAFYLHHFPSARSDESALIAQEKERDRIRNLRLENGFPVDKGQKFTGQIAGDNGHKGGADDDMDIGKSQDLPDVQSFEELLRSAFKSYVLARTRLNPWQQQRLAGGAPAMSRQMSGANGASKEPPKPLALTTTWQRPDGAASSALNSEEQGGGGRASVTGMGGDQDQWEIDNLGRPIPKLDRRQLQERIALEATMARQVFRAGLFLLMMAFFLACVGTYDPVQQVGDIHRTLFARFKAEELSSITTRDEIYNYLQDFIETSYQHSAVLTDANTLDAIDPNSCFSSEVTRLCRLAYWESDWNRSDPKQVIRMKPVRNYPYVSLVPLAPMVMQTRGTAGGCSGFGDKYINVLNSTSFNSPLGDTFDAFDPFATYQVRYVDDAIRCVNRDLIEDRWWDNMGGLEGRWLSNKKFGSRDVLYLFVTDTMNMTVRSFVDVQSNYVGIAILFITPQGESYADVFTLLQVHFDVNQVGAVKAQMDLQSTSVTPDAWHYLTYFTIALCMVYLFYVLFVFCRSKWARGPLLAFDAVLGLAGAGYLLLQVYVDVSPPHIDVELDKAFKANQGSVYFDVFTSIAGYSQVSQTLKILGFAVIYAMFLRLVLYLALHPRIAVLVNTLVHAWDDIQHFLISFTLLYIVLAFLSFWMFGTMFEAFGTFGDAMLTQYKMLIGEWPWVESTDPQLFIYFLTYSLIMFFILLNFFLAIVVDTFTRVQEVVQETMVEKTFFSDCRDCVSYLWKCRTLGWPSPMRVEEYLNMRLMDDDEPFTAKEVVLRSKKGLEFQGLDKPHKAAKWLRYYAGKIWEDGRFVLEWQKPEEAGGAASKEAEGEEDDEKGDVVKGTLTQVLLMSFEAFLNAELPGLPDEDRRRLIYDATWENFFAQDPDPTMASAAGEDKGGNEKEHAQAAANAKVLAEHVSGLFEGGEVNEAIAHAVRTEMQRHHSAVSTMIQSAPSLHLAGPSSSSPLNRSGSSSTALARTQGANGAGTNGANGANGANGSALGGSSGASGFFSGLMGGSSGSGILGGGK